MNRPQPIACAAGLLLAFCCGSGRAEPALTHCLPGAVMPGKTVEVTFFGKELGRAGETVTLRTSFPAEITSVEATGSKDEKQDAQRSKLSFRIKVVENVPVELGAVWLATPSGIASPLLMMVDDIPSVAENGGNNSPATAQGIELPAAIDGRSDGTKPDYYKFSAKGGQRVSIEVVATRLGSPLDPQVRLSDSEGNELAFADDDDSLGADCRLSHTFAADGEYLLELRDVRYQSGHRYRLRMGDFPLVTVPFPLGGRLGSKAELAFAGSAADSAAISVRIPSQVPGGRLPISVRLPGGNSSGMATIVASDLSEIMEAEPNDMPAAATKIAVPCAVNGRLEKPRDRDYFQFDAKKGQALVLRGLSRSLGSPSYLYMQLLKPDGGSAATADTGDAEEATLRYTIAADGTYRLMVEDLSRRGGPGHAYRVEIRPAVASFSLSLKSDKNARDRFFTSTGGAFALDVQCGRSGYDGPIELSVTTDARPLEVLGGHIAAKQKAARLIVDVPRDAQPGDLHLLRVVGRAKIDDRDVEVAVSTAGLLRQRLPMIAHPPTPLDGRLGLGIGPQAEPLFVVTYPGEAIYYPRHIGHVQFKLVLQRKHKDFKDTLAVLAQGLPAGVKIEAKRGKGGKQEEYQVTLSGPAELAEGKHPLRLVGYGEIKNKRGHKEVVEVPLEVFTPVAVKIEPLAALAPGDKQKAKITITRRLHNGAEAEPVTVRWLKRPPGVGGPDEVTIAKDKNEAELELVAQPDAAPGKFTDLAVEARTKYLGEEIKVHSPPAALEVKK